MTPKTIVASFRATGVYPFNREAIHVPEVSKPTCDRLDTGVISYLPLYSPAPKRSSACTMASVPTPEFSKSEQELFHTRRENGYDITSDHRYNQWLLLKQEDDKFIMEYEIKVSEHTAEDEIKSSDCKASAYPITPKEPSSIQNLLQIPELPSNLKKNSERKFRTARVLTSNATMQQMEEKERKKMEEEVKKECRREERQQRARQRAEEQANNKKKAEEKRKEKEQAQREKERKKERIRKEKEETKREKERVKKEEKEKTRVQPQRRD